MFQGKPPSDEHLLKLCTDVLRSKYLLVFYVTLLRTREGKPGSEIQSETAVLHVELHISQNSYDRFTLIITNYLNWLHCLIC